MSAMRNEITIAAQPEAIYRLASDTERWSEYLPHYRFVRILSRERDRCVVDMAAVRPLPFGRHDYGIPVRWTAEQQNDPERFRIDFHHLSGWTRGMRVRWQIGRHGAGAYVTIDHDVCFASPIFQDWLAEHVAGKFFIHAIATQTLARFKAIAESAPGALQ